MEEFNYLQTFYKAVIQLYIFLNAPSALAVMLGLSKRNTVAERLQASRQICIIGTFLLFIFAIFGPIILEYVFRISTEAFRVGGGLYLFYIGLSMALSKDSEDDVDHHQTANDISKFVITPLATPLLVGPGTITATLVQRKALPDGLGYSLTFYAALACAMALVYVTFILGCKFSKNLKPLFLKVLEKLIGILILCLAISSILAGIKTFLESV
jgi:multiple antibiotic resistance protein